MYIQIDAIFIYIYVELLEFIFTSCGRRCKEHRATFKILFVYMYM